MFKMDIRNKEVMAGYGLPVNHTVWGGESKMSDEGQRYKTSHIIDSEDMLLNWKPLMQINTGSMLGLSENGHWIIEEQTGVRVLDETWKFNRLMVLLERQITEFRQELINAAITCTIDNDIVREFPFYEVVKVGFEQKSEYWVELALNWWIMLPQENEEIIKSLEKIEISKWASQKLRHRIKKELRTRRAFLSFTSGSGCNGVEKR
ncbi:hypothetical protein WBG83_07425 [Paenibacillus sp. y28]